MNQYQKYHTTNDQILFKITNGKYNVNILKEVHYKKGIGRCFIFEYVKQMENIIMNLYHIIY
jgi:hypothetical protein